MKKKKIAISANVLFTILNFRKELILALKKNNYEVVCIANTDELSNIYDELIKELEIEFIQVDIDRKGINPIKDLQYLFSLVSVYKKVSPDVILHFTIKPNIYGTIAAKIAGIKSINTINGLGSAIIKDNFLSKILKYLYKISLSFSSKIFFQNSDDLDFFVSQKLAIREKVSIVPGSGVDTSQFDRYDTNNRDLHFLLVARLLKDKGVYEYIEAIRMLKEVGTTCKFLLGGQFDFGNPSAITEDEVKKWEEEDLIKYIGKTDDIRSFFIQSDIIVLPSYREGLSRLLIEAASAYKPIITSNVAGCKDVVNDGTNGFLCDVKDSVSLKSAMEKIASLSSGKIEQMQVASREIAEKRFDRSIVNEIYLEAIEKV